MATLNRIRLIVDLPEGSIVATSREVPHCQCIANRGAVHYHVTLSGEKLVGADLVALADDIAHKLGRESSFEFVTKVGRVKTPPR
jgi:hypothetical protein